MKKVLASILLWTIVITTAVPCFAIALALWMVTTPFDRQRRINHLFNCAWAYLYILFFPGCRVRVFGREKIDPHKAYVLAANHSSIADIVLVFLLFRPFKWVSKRSIFALPIFGWNMWMCGYIPLVRGDSESIKKMLAECRRTLQAGTSVMMFPEGTRSLDGQVRPFKHGAFSLALDTQVPVIPVVIHNAHHMIKKHASTIKGQVDMTIEVLDPVPASNFKDPASYAEHVRELIRTRLGQAPAAESSPIHSHPVGNT